MNKAENKNLLSHGHLPGSFVRINNDCIPDISFLHLKGFITSRIQTKFEASEQTGLIISVQLLQNNRCVQFCSSTKVELNFSPVVKSVQIMKASIAFQHTYENPGSINRLDIYIPASKAKVLFSEDHLAEINQKEIVNYTMLDTGIRSKILDKKLRELMEGLDSPNTKSICNPLEDFILSLNP